MRPSRALAVAALALAAAAPVAGIGPEAAAETACDPGGGPTVALPDPTVELGGTLELTGTGWCHPTDGGSRIAVKIDLGAYSRPDTTVHANKTIWAIIDADPAGGGFTASLELPDGTEAESTPAFTTGAHTLQLLTGSLKTGDAVRTVASPTFTVVEPGSEVPDHPSWTHVDLAAGSAVAWVESDLPAGDGTSLRIAGFGWTRTGGGGSTVAVKLGSGPGGEQYRRTGSRVLQQDPTIWALLRPDGGSKPNVHAIGDDGSFEATLDLPDDLEAGQYLTVSLLSGKFAAGDAQRSATTVPLTVGGVPWEGDDGGSDEECEPTTADAQVQLGATRVDLGDRLLVTGTGWCNPAGGGSVVAIKIDDGAYSHLDDAVSTNRTIWAVVAADPADGTFRTQVRLPDGTAGTSSPAFTRGSHTLRFLSGSLASGDTVRTVQSAEFVVGRYRPNGTPEPLDPARLRAATRHDVAAVVRNHRLRVTAPRSPAGTWCFVSVYAADGSPRYPWTRWLRLDRHHRVALGLGGSGLTGRGRVVVQSGESGEVGRLLGWDRARFGAGGKPDPQPDPEPDPEPTPEPLPDRTPEPGPSPETSPTPAPPYPSSPAPPLVDAPGSPTAKAAPQPPVAAFADLDPADDGRVRAELDATSVATVEVAGAQPGDEVFLYVYAPDQVVPAGWVVLDDDRTARLDLSGWGAGYVGVTAQDGAGALLGWAPLALPEPAATNTVADPVAESPSVVVQQVAAPAAATWIGPTDGLLLAAGALVLAAVSLITSRRPARSSAPRTLR